MNASKIAVVLVILAVVCPSFGAYIYYVSSHSVPSDLLSWLNQKGHVVNYQYTPNAFTTYIQTAYDIVIYQNDGGVGWDPTYQSYIEDYVRNGGVFLYIGRASLDSQDPTMLSVLGISSAFNLGPSNSPFAFNNAISTDVRCYPLTNGYRKDLRNIVPSSYYPRWVQLHLQETTEATVIDGISCLTSSFAGNAIWMIRDSVGSGKIVEMSLSTYVVEEFWKPGFYQAAFMNLLAYSSTGIIFGDPHVITLGKLAFDMPDEAEGNYFNFYSSPTVSVSGRVQRLDSMAEGLWVTEVGVTFTYRAREHQLHCFFDAEIMNFKFVLDGKALSSPEKTMAWEFDLENEAVVGTWLNFGQFVSPGLFKLLKPDDGSKVIVQAVEWRDAPSFSVEVHEPIGEVADSLQHSRSYSLGLLQHPVESTRDTEQVPNVLQYSQTHLFANW